MTLKEWTICFIKNKDLIFRKLVDYEEKENSILFHFKDKDHNYFIEEELNTFSLELVKLSGLKTIVCLATKSNLKFFMSNWNKFKVVEELSFIFANPVSNTKWLINPFVHNKICDEDSLKTGLESMFSNAFSL